MANTDVVLSLKEQPLRLLNHPAIPSRPVIVCLHRSDPHHDGAALAQLLAAIDDGRIAACVRCAVSTSIAYGAAGIPEELLTVIPNGVDLTRFHPAGARERAALRRELGIPARAPVVVLAARYDVMKNVPLFLQAARHYLDDEPTGRVLLCGAGMITANAELNNLLGAVFADRPRLLRRVGLLGVRHDMPAVGLAHGKRRAGLLLPSTHRANPAFASSSRVRGSAAGIWRRCARRWF